MNYEELKEILDSELKLRTLDSFAAAICEVESAAGVRLLIESLYRHIPKEETV